MVRRVIHAEAGAVALAAVACLIATPFLADVDRGRLWSMGVALSVIAVACVMSADATEVGRWRAAVGVACAVGVFAVSVPLGNAPLSGPPASASRGVQVLARAGLMLGWPIGLLVGLSVLKATVLGWRRDISLRLAVAASIVVPLAGLLVLPVAAALSTTWSAGLGVALAVLVGSAMLVGHTEIVGRLAVWEARACRAQMPPRLCAGLERLRDGVGFEFDEVLVEDGDGIACSVFQNLENRATLVVSTAIVREHEPDELMSIVAHEAGHVVLRHRRRTTWRQCASTAALVLTMASTYWVARSWGQPVLSRAILAAAFVAASAQHLYLRASRRAFEFEADQFAASRTGAEPLVRALRRSEALLEARTPRRRPSIDIEDRVARFSRGVL